jgi:tetratricopeptide (TPR) repeat protein
MRFFFNIAFCLFAFFANAQHEKNAEELLASAIMHYDGKRYELCLQDLDQAVLVNHNGELSDILYYYKAMTYVRLQKNKWAISQMDTAIQFRNDKAHYYNFRAEIHLNSGDFLAAEADLDRSLLINNKQDEVLVSKGMIVQERGNITDAIAYYGSALEINAQNSMALYLRGLIYLQNGMAEEGCIDLKKSAALNYSAAMENSRRYCE